MQGLRTFIHHPNVGCTTHPTTHAVLRALDAVVEAEAPSMITLLGKAATGKSRLLDYWAGVYRAEECGINIENAPIVYAKFDETLRSATGRRISVATATFQAIIYGLAELALRRGRTLRWYDQLRSSSDAHFMWLFDQVCLEIRQLNVRALVVDNAHLLDVTTIAALMKVLARQRYQVALVFGAQLDEGETVDEPMGKLFDQAKVDPAAYETAVELKPLDEATFYEPVLDALFEDIDADFEAGLEAHYEFIGARLYDITRGDWKSIDGRVRHLNRLLGPRAAGRRVITRSIVEQVLGQALPTT